MRATARLARLEAGLPTGEAVMAWIAQVSAYGSLAAYAAAQLTANSTGSPLWALVSRVQAGAVRSRRGTGRPAEIRAAARDQAREALCLAQSILDINLLAEETLIREGLQLAALACRMHRSGSKLPRWSAGPDLLALVGRLYLAQETRLFIEHRFLSDHSCLLADNAAHWQAMLDAAENLAAAVGLALPKTRAAARAGAAAGAAALVEAARWATLELLADHDGADQIAEQRLRAIA